MDLKIDTTQTINKGRHNKDDLITQRCPQGELGDIKPAKIEAQHYFSSSLLIKNPTLGQYGAILPAVCKMRAGRRW